MSAPDAPVFLDANVFMYAAGAPHLYREPCIRILADAEQGILAAVTNTEVLQEILYRYSHIGMGGKGIALCRLVMRYPIGLLAVDAPDIAEALQILSVHGTQGVRPRDAIHAASMRNHGVQRVLTADQHFDVFPFISRMDPLTYPLP